MPSRLVVTKGWNSCSAISGGDAGAGVGDADLDHVVRQQAAVMHQARAGRTLGHRLDGVAHQVEQHLLDLHLVGQHQVGARIELEAHPHAVLLGADQRQRARLLDQLGEALDPPLGFAARDEIAQPADDLAGAQRLLGGLVQRVARRVSERSSVAASSRRRDPFR